MHNATKVPVKLDWSLRLRTVELSSFGLICLERGVRKVMEWAPNFHSQSERQFLGDGGAMVVQRAWGRILMSNSEVRRRCLDLFPGEGRSESDGMDDVSNVLSLSV